MCFTTLICVNIEHFVSNTVRYAAITSNCIDARVTSEGENLRLLVQGLCGVVLTTSSTSYYFAPFQALGARGTLTWW
jgi:hypothetical protein